MARASPRRWRSSATTTTCRISSARSDEDVFYALGLRPRAGPAVADDNAAADGAGAAVGNLSGPATVKVDELMQAAMTFTGWRCSRSRSQDDATNGCAVGGLCGRGERLDRSRSTRARAGAWRTGVLPLFEPRDFGLGAGGFSIAILKLMSLQLSSASADRGLAGAQMSLLLPPRAAGRHPAR